ncbi:uncharacterized protein KY384_008967 [Bacidia gigantensis]|uniref:uncharacterized protein n=1 Tax=Bacidia gigantensis TaxID=2732470 RepID=UPI001D04FA3D|nr:uncharacterized protein KY384_008967 [Bacidia gigantensis]KAG8525323.1 hypothetical protein KY384_008967 [Bacidia gigantensis]
MCIQYICRDCRHACVGPDSIERCPSYYLIAEEDRGKPICPANDFKYLTRAEGIHENNAPCPGPTPKYHHRLQNSQPISPHHQAKVTAKSKHKMNDYHDPSIYVKPGQLWHEETLYNVRNGPCMDTEAGLALRHACDTLQNTEANGVAARYDRDHIRRRSQTPLPDYGGGSISGSSVAGSGSMAPPAYVPNRHGPAHQIGNMAGSSRRAKEDPVEVPRSIVKMLDDSRRSADARPTTEQIVAAEMVARYQNPLPDGYTWPGDGDNEERKPTRTLGSPFHPINKKPKGHRGSE